MARLTLSEFALKMSEIMPFIMREFVKTQANEFYKLKVTLPQFVVMDLLNRLGKTRMTDIANSIGVTTAAMTGIVDRLARDGYLVRIDDTKDRRVTKIALTKKGAYVVGKITRHRRDTIIKIFGMLSQRERETYLAILTTIRDRLKNRE